MVMLVEKVQNQEIDLKDEVSANLLLKDVSYE